VKPRAIRSNILSGSSFLLVASTVVIPISAAQITWEDQKDYNWHNAANWNPATVPGTTDDAWIRSGLAYVTDGAANARSVVIGGEAYPYLELSIGSSLRTAAGTNNALGLDIRSGSVVIAFGGSLTTQSVELRGTGEWDDRVLVWAYDRSSGRRSQWLNTGDMTLYQGGNFAVEAGALAESRGLTVIDGGHAWISGAGDEPSTWRMDRLVVEDNAASDSPELVVMQNAWITTHSATVRGSVSIKPDRAWFYGRSGATWESASILVVGGTIDLEEGSHLKTGVLSIHGGEVRIGRGEGPLVTAEIGKLEVDAGGKLVLDGGTLLFRKSATAFTGIGAGEIVIESGGATIQAGGDTYPAGKNVRVAIDARLQGSGGLETWTYGSIELTRANTYQGGTTILNGTLIVNNVEGSATGDGNVWVYPLGTLSGDGFIADSVINEGTVAPGNSSGTLHIGGDFRQDSTGHLFMEIESPGRYDVLSIGGSTRLGGSLSIESTSPVNFGEFKLIQSKGPISGAFDTFTFSSPTAGRITFRTEGGTGTLVVAPDSYTQVAQTRNEVRLARTLDTWIDDPAGDTKTISQSLDLLTAGEYRRAFAQISPALYGAALDTGIEQSQSQTTALGEFLHSRRLRTPLADSSKNPEAPKNWEVWGLATGLFSSGSISSLQGGDFASGGILSGAEYQTERGFSAGFFTGYSHGDGDFSGGSETDLNRFAIGGYATATHRGFYANSVLGLGILDLDVTRSIRFANLSRTANSGTDGTEFFGLISGGYDFHQSRWTFGPAASLQYSAARYDDVREHGAGALDLALDNPEEYSLRSRIGGRVAYSQPVNEQLTLIPEIRVFWQHEFLTDEETLYTSLEGGNGGAFDHDVAGADSDSVTTGLALGFQTPIGFYGNISYDLELGRESEVNQTISIGADWTF
jgi:autotransporter-associated beta strand protein